MATVAELLVRIAADVGDALGGLGKVKAEAVDVSKGIAAGFGVAGVAVGAFALDAIKSLGGLEKLSAQTAAAIKSTGAAAGVSVGQVERLTQSIEKMSGIEQEAVQAGANMLLTFTNIRNGVGAGNDIFNQATKTMVNLATAMGGDTKGAAIQLGKALNDPINGITALTRVGVTFTDEQKKQIAALQAAGKTYEAQKIILAELNKEFGGTAEAMGATFLGHVEMAKNAFGDIGEAIMTGTMPALDGLVKSLTADFRTAAAEIQRVGLVEWLTELVAPTDTAKAMVVALAGAMVGALIPSFISAAQAIAAGVVAIGPWLLAGAAVAIVAYDIYQAYQVLPPFFAALWGNITALFQRATGAIGLAVKVGLQYVSDLFSWLPSSVSAAMGSLYSAVKGWIADKLGAVWDWLGQKLSTVAGWFSSLTGGVIGSVAPMVGKIGGFADQIGSAFVRIPKMIAPAMASIPGAVEPHLASVGDSAAKHAGKAKHHLDKLTESMKDLITATKAVGKAEEYFALQLAHGGAKASDFDKAIEANEKAIQSYLRNGIKPGSIAIQGFADRIDDLIRGKNALAVAAYRATRANDALTDSLKATAKPSEDFTKGMDSLILNLDKASIKTALYGDTQDTLKAQIKEVEGAIELMAAQWGANSETVKLLTKDLDALKTKLGALKDPVKEAQKEYQRTADSVRFWGDQVKLLAGPLGGIADKLGLMNPRLSEAGTFAANAAEGIVKMTAAMAKGDEELGKQAGWAALIAHLAQGIKIIQKGLGDIQDVFVEAGRRFGKVFAQPIEDAGRAIGTFSGSIGKLLSDNLSLDAFAADFSAQLRKVIEGAISEQIMSEYVNKALYGPMVVLMNALKSGSKAWIAEATADLKSAAATAISGASAFADQARPILDDLFKSGSGGSQSVSLGGMMTSNGAIDSATAYANYLKSFDASAAAQAQVPMAGLPIAQPVPMRETSQAPQVNITVTGNTVLNDRDANALGQAIVRAAASRGLQFA